MLAARGGGGLVKCVDYTGSCYKYTLAKDFDNIGCCVQRCKHQNYRNGRCLQHAMEYSAKLAMDRRKVKLLWVFKEFGAACVLGSSEMLNSLI